MVALLKRSAGRVAKYLPAQYAIPVVALLVTCFGSILVLLLVTTAAQDRMQVERERQALETALATAEGMTQHDLQDYAKWDDAVRHIAQGFSTDWVDDNVTAYLGGTQGYPHIFALDGQDHTLFSYRSRAGARDDARAILGKDFAQSLSHVRAMPRPDGPIATGFSRTGDRLFVYATAAIVPLTNKVSISNAPTHLLVIARQVDEEFLGKVTGDLPLQKVQLVRSTIPPQGEFVVLRGHEGRAIGYVGWTPHTPGSDVRRELLPAILAISLLALAAAALILRRGSQTVTALIASEGRARYNSEHDPLTGLANRRALATEISSRLDAGEELTLLYMDLDGFKDANDVYGHVAGDMLLRQAAERIASVSRSIMIARTGGDEFAVLLAAAPTLCAPAACEAILGSFQAPFTIGANQVSMNLSIGHADSSQLEERQPDELVRRADVAMYIAKSEGKGCWRRYESCMDDGHRLRMLMERDLQESIAKGEINVLFQPIVDSSSKRIVAVEALARWTHPHHGQVPPDVFIPIAEISGLISDLGRHVLHRACTAALAYDVELSVNLSPVQFWDRNLVATIADTLRETGFPPSSLELEITENYLLHRPEAAAAIIDNLRDLGVKIALDDFGAGFASIGYLQQLKLDRMKIDRAFIAPLTLNPSAREMLVSIVGLARAFRLDVTAEGIETEGQAVLASVAGCHRMQGWLYGKPADLADLPLLPREAARSNQQ